MWATLTTNIAANVVAPANAFVNVAPDRLSFNAGAVLTALIGLVIMPWKLVGSWRATGAAAGGRWLVIGSWFVCSWSWVRQVKAMEAGDSKKMVGSSG